LTYQFAALSHATKYTRKGRNFWTLAWSTVNTDYKAGFR
jgi:hypothetical protein